MKNILCTFFCLVMLPTYAQEKVVPNSPILKEACIPSYSNAISYGPTKVELGSINNTSDYYNRNGNNVFYTDYSSTYFTDIYDNQENTLVVSLEPNKNRVVRAWIDYDNNGVFSDNEFIRNSSNGVNESSISISFNIPSNAIKNTYLRLRILVEFIATESHCSGIYGEIEDYAVRIVSKNPPSSNDGFSIGRVGINTDQPQATLDIREKPLSELPEGQAQGVSLPNFTTAERNTFTNVRTGTIIYNTENKCIEVYKGNVTGWQCLNSN